jgi:hypothetical protein
MNQFVSNYPVEEYTTSPSTHATEFGEGTRDFNSAEMKWSML